MCVYSKTKSLHYLECTVLAVSFPVARVFVHRYIVCVKRLTTIIDIVYLTTGNLNKSLSYRKKTAERFGPRPITSRNVP